MFYTILKMRFLILLFLIFSTYVQVFAQIDSLLVLKNELQGTKNNTEHIAMLCRLASLSLENQPVSTMKYASEAIALQEDTVVTKNTIEAYLLLQDAFKKLDNIEKLADNSLKLANFYEKINDINKQVSYLALSGEMYQQAGKFDKAIKVFYARVSAEEQQNNLVGRLEALNAVGSILRIERKFADAYKLFFENLQQAQRLNETMPPNDPIKKRTLLMLAENYNLIGAAHYWQDNLDSALIYFQKSYPLRIEANDSTAMAKSMNNIALIYRKKGDYKKSLNYFSDAIRILIAKDSALAVPSISNLGLTYSLMGDNENAIKYLNLSLELGVRKNVTTRVLESYEGLVAHYIRLKDYQKVYEYQLKVELLKDSLFNENSAKQIASMNALYETDKHKQSVQIHKLESENKTNSIYFILAVVISLVIAVLILYNRFMLKKRSNELLQQQYQEINQQKEELDTQRNYIEDQNKILTKQHTDIISSITYAKRIQNATLPPVEEIKKAFPNSFVLFKPKSVVSGDFYWFAQETDEKTGDLHQIIAAVDCTGHGVPGAFMSLIGNTLLDEIVHISQILSPELILVELDKRIRKLLKQQEDASQKDGMDLVICNYNKTQNYLDFAGAMNPLLAIIDDEAKLYKGDRFAIGGAGIAENAKKFSKQRIDLNKTDLNKTKTIFYLFSDGFQDQFGGKESKKFMLKNFKNLLVDIHKKPFSEQKNILDTTIIEWQEVGNEEQIDDILVIGFEISF